MLLKKDLSQCKDLRTVEHLAQQFGWYAAAWTPQEPHLICSDEQFTEFAKALGKLAVTQDGENLLYFLALAAETAQASVPVVLTVVNSVSPISVSVPACLPVTVLDGYVVTASNAVIENRAQSGAVQVVAVDVQHGAFAIGDFENFGSEAGKIAFSINGCKTVKEGKLTLADGAFPVIDAGKDLRIAYTAKVAAAEKVEKVNAATLIFTIAPATGNS